MSSSLIFYFQMFSSFYHENHDYDSSFQSTNNLALCFQFPNVWALTFVVAAAGFQFSYLTVRQVGL
jgi:hypothetical protein